MVVFVDVYPWTNRPPRSGSHCDDNQYTGSAPPAGTAKDGVPQPRLAGAPPETKVIVERGWREVEREAVRTPFFQATAAAAFANLGDVMRPPDVVTNVSPSR